MRLYSTIFCFLAATPAFTAEPATSDIPLPSAGIQTFTGSAKGGNSTSFTLRSAEMRSLTFSINGNRENCSVIVRKSSQHGYLSGFEYLPAKSHVLAAVDETFILSFYQTRSAFISKAACEFNFSVE